MKPDMHILATRTHSSQNIQKLGHLDEKLKKWESNLRRTQLSTPKTKAGSVKLRKTLK